MPWQRLDSLSVDPSEAQHKKLNTKSSTKAELVPHKKLNQSGTGWWMDDVMPLIVWTRYYLDAQGYGVSENMVFQDNQSAILL
jgi:hypothetical protein